MTTTQISTRYLGSCPTCNHGIASETGSTAACTNCGERVRLQRMVGVYSDAHPCNDDCQYARMPQCVCGCGGANHGVGYIAPVAERPVWVTERDAKRGQAKKDRAAAKEAKARRSLAEKVAAIVEEHPALAPLAAEDYDTGNYFLADIAHSLRTNGVLSDRQITKAEEAIERDAARAARQQEREAAEAAARAAGVQVPTGKAVQVEGRLTGVESEDTGFGYNSSAWRGVLRHDDGWSVKITVPSTLIEAAMALQVAATRNGEERRPWTAYLDRVALTVDLDGPWTPKGETEPKDVLWGYGKRPRKARPLEG